MSVLNVRRTSSADYGRYLKVLLCGTPGAGKTLFSSTFPNPLFLITEPGLMSVFDRDVPYIHIESSDHLMTIKQALEQDPAPRAKLFSVPVDTVVIDTTDEMQQILVAERMKEMKRDHLELKDYGWLKERFAAIIKGFRNLDMHVVFTCHLKDSHDDSTGATSRKPGLTGGISDEIAGYVDLSLLIKAVPGVEIIDNESHRVINRFIQSFPDAQHDFIKDRSGKLPQEFKVNFTDDFERMSTRIYGAPTALDTSDGDRPDLAHVQPTSEVEADTGNAAVVPGEAPQSPPEAPESQVEVEVPAIAPAASEGFTCDSCGEGFTDEDQADLSRIRFRKLLCKPCFKGSQA